VIHWEKYAGIIAVSPGLAAIFSFLAVFPILIPVAGAQSPWLRNKAGLYAQASWQFIPTYEKIFPATTGYTVQPERKLAENTFQLYGEYGLTSQTTVLISLPVRYNTAGVLIHPAANASTESGGLAGLGNTTLAIRQSLLKTRMPLTLTLRADLPAFSYNDRTGLRTGFPAWTLMPMLSTGLGFGKSYAFAYAGYGYRTHHFSHLLDLGAEAGRRFGKLYLIAFTEWSPTLKNSNTIVPQANRYTSLYINDQCFWSFGFKGIYQFNRFTGIIVSLAGALQAALLPESPGIGFGFYFKWD
jgi:hypothetical protein